MAVEWMEKNTPANEELIRFRAEAAELLAVDEKKRHDPTTAPATAKSQPPTK